MDNRKLRLTNEVIDAINEELEYQGSLLAQNRTDGIHYGTAGQALTLLEYADRAARAWVTNPGNDETLHNLRKCAAIAIRALLTESCPRRRPWYEASASDAFAPEVGAGAGD